MSASVGTSAGPRGAESQDFELNLASIIDCFTVLITFMLASASFLSIGILDAGISAAASAPSNETPPPINITVELGKEHKLAIKVSGKATNTVNLTAKEGGWDYEAMTQNLASLKAKWPTVNALTLNADESIEYRDVVKTMDTARKTLPVVLLGGF